MARVAPHSSIRVAARLANAFALDLVKLGSLGRDVVDALLLAAISQANVAQITRNPELQRAYATIDQPPPDSLRRPVSVSAVANSLRIPFETTRRRVTALSELGLIVTTPKGVIIPQGPLNSPVYRTITEAHFELVRRLYFRLRAIGLLENLPAALGAPFASDDPPVRLVVRLSADYVLRLAEPLNLHIGHLVTGLILMDIVNANTEHLDDSDGGWADWSPEAFVPDHHRQPVRTGTLAQRLGMPQETVRRHVGRLLERDLCARVDDGYVVPSRILARDRFVQFMLDNQSHLQRLFAGLAEFGVLTQWERDVEALRGAA